MWHYLSRGNFFGVYFELLKEVVVSLQNALWMLKKLLYLFLWIWFLFSLSSISEGDR